MEIISYNQGTTAKGKVSEVDARLSNVDNTADMDKPLSTPQSDAIAGAGGGTEFVASGALTSGEVVSLNADGSVSVVTGSIIQHWIGISQDTVVDAEAVKVTTIGGVDDNQSGLTTGTEYFVDGDGSLTTTDTGYPIGKALSATDILIEG